MLEKLLLKPAAAEYAQRANYYRRRAVVESIEQGILDHIADGNAPGVDIIDPMEGVEIMIPGTDKLLQFAFGRDGIAFARIEGGMYYPIASDGFGFNLDAARHNDRLSRSFLRRVLNEGSRQEDRKWFELGIKVNNISDRLVEKLVQIHTSLQSLNE